MASLIDEMSDRLDELAAAGDALAEVRAVHRLDVLVRRAKAQIIRNALVTHSYRAVAHELSMTRQGVSKAWPKDGRSGPGIATRPASTL